MSGHHVHVVGGTLAGVAAALRLAHVGHRVTLDPAGPLGGRASGRQLAPGVGVDDLEPVLTLPAAWRDLLKKSGRHLVTELNRHHLELVPAPPAVHRWADGTEIVLPDDRGGQLQALRAALGADAAQAWGRLMDRCDDLWQALRLHGVERPFPAELSRAEAEQLAHGTTLAQLGQGLDPKLVDLLHSAARRAGAIDPARAPAWLASRWSLTRTFGRWHLTGEQGALPLSAMVDVLADRLAERGVELEANPHDAEAVIDALTPTPPLVRISAWSRLRGRAQQPVAVRPPRITHDLHDDLPPVEGIQETVFHTGSGTIVGWQRSTPAGLLVTTHDHTQPQEADPAHGWDLSGWELWRRRPLLGPLAAGQPWRASAASHAGNEPWAEILSGALVTYLVHEQLTGQDIRPTNKELTTHRPRGRGASV